MLVLIVQSPSLAWEERGSRGGGAEAGGMKGIGGMGGGMKGVGGMGGGFKGIGGMGGGMKGIGGMGGGMRGADWGSYGSNNRYGENSHRYGENSHRYGENSHRYGENSTRYGGDGESTYERSPDSYAGSAFNHESEQSYGYGGTNGYGNDNFAARYERSQLYGGLMRHFAGAPQYQSGGAAYGQAPASTGGPMMALGSVFSRMKAMEGASPRGYTSTVPPNSFNHIYVPGR